MYDVCLSLTSFSVKIYRCIRVAADGIISFCFIDEWQSIVYKHHIFIHSSVDGHLGCFYVLAIVNSQWILGCIYLFKLEFSPDIRLGVGLLDYIVTIFSSLRNFHTVLHSGYTNLHSYQQCRRIFSLHILSSIYYL